MKRLLQDYSTSVSKYFMLNAAVPAEAYDDPPTSRTFEATTVPKGLIHDAWRDYPAETWAAFWHRHFFPTDDYTPTEADVARSTLTWKGRFKDVLTNRGVTVYNYYSAGNSEASGDEVFELQETTPAAWDGILTDGKGQYSWQKQECWKGRRESRIGAVLASDKMGWGFVTDEQLTENSGESSEAESEENTAENLCSRAQQKEFADSEYREDPIFYRNPTSILSDSATTIVAQRDHLLAYGIPAMTNAAGKSPLSALEEEGREIDCQTVYVNESWGVDSTGRPTGRWLHSDMKNKSYPYLRAFYNSIVERIKQQ